MEYDRGTERLRKYAAKLRAYYSYRDSAQAAREYNGFPAVLFVTTDPAAEERIAEVADRAWFIRGIEPLPVLVTTTARIKESGDGILGPMWRVIPTESHSSTASLRAWPSNSSPWVARRATVSMFDIEVLFSGEAPRD
jgi:hypothetical protein